MLHFDVIPVRCFQSVTLKQFMSSRLGREDSRDRAELIETVNKMLSLNKVVIQPDKVPMQIDSWSLQGVILLQN